MSARATPPPPRGRTERLAYVFFHRPRGDVGRRSYEDALRRFHVGLMRSPPTGFLRSVALQLPAAPWPEPSAGTVYVDWYLVEGFRTLDPIREVAYRPPWVRSHRAIARRAADGWGALYAAARPAGLPRPGDRLVWFSSEARPGLESGRGKPPPGTLWRRQLALGRSPGYCWASSAEVPPTLARAARITSPRFVFPPEPGGRQ